MPVNPLVVDIETVGVDWSGLDGEVQEYLLGKARTEEERFTVPQRLALHPATGQIIAIGMWRVESDRGGVLLEGDAAGWQDFGDGAKLFQGSEKELLAEFWRTVQSKQTLVTFNGRGFDGPYLMIRSAMLGVTPSRNLVPYRYRFEEHCDLAEVLTFFRARPMDSLDFWCRQFGVESPKGEMDGSEVEVAYEAGELEAIARYSLRDVKATADLYRRLQSLIAVMDPGRG